MIIKSIKLNKKLILSIIIFMILSSSILIFYSFANSEQSSDEKNYIKWVDFSITCSALELTSKLDIDSHNNASSIKYNWIELLAYLACKNGRKLQEV